MHARLTLIRTVHGSTEPPVCVQRYHGHALAAGEGAEDVAVHAAMKVLDVILAEVFLDIAVNAAADQLIPFLGAAITTATLQHNRSRIVDRVIVKARARHTAWLTETEQLNQAHFR